MRHDLNIWPEFYTPIQSGHDTIEVRDNGYRVGDLLRLHEWEPGGFGGLTGRRTTTVVTNVRRSEDGYVVLSLRPATGEERG